MKRDEKPCNVTAYFSNGFSFDISLVICDEGRPYIDTVLYDNYGIEVNCEVHDGNINDEYYITYGSDEYCVVIATE
ncbi:hypothetical protein LJB89_03695 [Tyzzerella sp. OttesenSCG-928-J15]|nr:hypothetical protein [Tyzzerella sp. OttesenSCG-928-J15]